VPATLLSEFSSRLFILSKKKTLGILAFFLSIFTACLLTSCGVHVNGLSSTQNPGQAVVAPVFTPVTGTSFASKLSVSITDATPGATIYYTMDGSVPSTSSTVYSGPITLGATTTVNAIAAETGYTTSTMASAVYTYAPVTVATPVFAPVTGTSFSSTLSVSITDATAGATIYYTTDGSVPSTSSTVYAGPITLSATTTVNAIAAAPGDTTSAMASATYTLMVSNTGLVSDNFDEPALNTSLWTIENPLLDGTVTMNGSAVTLNVPMGIVHDPWIGGNGTLRIMQPLSNGDFSADVRFQSAVEIGNQDEGILVEQDTDHFLRFDVVYEAGIGPSLFAAGINGAIETTFIDTPIPLPKGPLVLRLARAGNTWTGSWSTDGVTFSAAPSFAFDLNASQIGPYAGNANFAAYDTPGFTAVVDYFFNTGDPIPNQDGPLPYGYVTIDPAPAGTVVEKTLADIEGTGHLDAVIGLEQGTSGGNTSNGGIFWYQYPASGNVNDPWIKNTIIASGNAYEDMTAYDVNGDGAVDIIAAFDATFSGGYSIVWFENPRGSGGNPVTDPWMMHLVGPGMGEDTLQLADIDGDGKTDIVTPSFIYFQNDPTSWTQVQYNTSFRGVALLDIGSGSGAINLVGTQSASPFSLVWWENPREAGGNARTGTWTMHTIGPGYPCGPNNCGDGGQIATFETMDVNGDGIKDVISAQSEGPPGVAPPPGGVIWWQAPADRRNGTWIKHTIDASVVDVHTMAIGDMDQNGTSDIVVAEQDQSPLQRVIVYYNDGKGNLTPEVISNAKGHNLCIGNVGGKPGELDILNSGHGYFQNSHPLQIFMNPY
jgi:hypothetical protein